jgi:hypothetical protein
MVPFCDPAPGWTTIPAGFSITARSSSSKTIWRFFEGMEIDFDCFSTSKAVPGFVVPAIDMDSARLIEVLYLRTTEILQALRKEDVQTHSPIVKSGLELHCG